MVIIRFIFLSLLKSFGKILYPAKVDWIGDKPNSWDEISVVLIINHTSLFEFVFGVLLPFRFLWNLSKRLVIPIADSTMSNPVANKVFNFIAPNTIAISRKRDGTWQHFLNSLNSKQICIFMPEGEMKRKNGLNKFGKPMRIKKGVFELLEKFRGKEVLIVYSKGLHHILAPGEKIPKFFKKISASLEYRNINSYLDEFKNEDDPISALVQDLQGKAEKYS